jgi:hypothetical protein
MKISFGHCCTVILSLVVFCGIAPAQKPPGPRTRTIQLVERAGLECQQFPVEVTVRVEKDVNPADIRLFRRDGDKRVPVAVQVLSAGADFRGVAGPMAQTFARLVLLADLPANGTVVYDVALDGERAAAGKAILKISGDGPGKAIDTGPMLIDLHNPSGQLLTFSPKAVNNDRLAFIQDPKKGPLPFHWNPDVWAPPTEWTHTHKWDQAVTFDPAKHQADAPPAGDGKSRPYFVHESQGPLAYRVARWGRMPLLRQIDAAVTYTFYAGAPVVRVHSLVEFREAMQVNAVRNAELVFSRHQFDTAVWIGKDGKVRTAPCYDYADKDRSFQVVSKLPADVPCVGLANEKKGYGIALVPLGMTNVNKSGSPVADEQAHFLIRDYDEHGRGNPYNFLYFVRYLAFRDNYGPTPVAAGTIFSEHSAVVVFKLNADAASRYDELVRWQKMLAQPPEVTAD